MDMSDLGVYMRREHGMAMLPDGFTFNQANLQDFVDCPRRFQLRYVQGQQWPAVAAEPLSEHEAFVRRGAQFHRSVERHQLGLPAAEIAAGLDDPVLHTWWDAYLGFEMLHALPGERFPELRLSAELFGVRAMAALDLVVVEPGSRVTIFDWKTYGHVPRREWLASRLQTVLYLYLLAAVGPEMWGDWLKPELLSMVYWFPVKPDSPVVFSYSRQQCQEAGDRLAGLIQAILVGGEGGIWPLTSETRLCEYCQFRSRCGRGIAAGAFGEFGELDEMAADAGGILAFEDVEEVGF